MDPNATLQAAREAIARWLAAADGASGDDECEAAAEASEAFDSLDEWLSKGGFLPDAWHASICLHSEGE